MVGERAKLSEQRRSHVELAGVDDQRGKPMLTRSAAGRDDSAEGTTDEHDPAVVDLGLGRERVEHLRHDVLPVRTHSDPTVIQRRPLPRPVDRRERISAIQSRWHRRIQLLRRRVITADMQDGGM